MTLPERTPNEKYEAEIIAPRIPLSERLTLTVKEAAQLIGVDLSTMYDLVHDRRIHSVRAGRKILIPRASIDAFLAAN